MSLYTKDGYLDFEWIYNRGLFWQIITGGRATGKTYGALKFFYEKKIRFIYLRRTQTQCDIISKPEFSPYKSYMLDNPDAHITVESGSKYTSAFVDQDTEEAFGYTAALSTFVNLRGFDGSDIKVILYDEFVPEKHEKAIKNEFKALLNVIETVNRNRELKGSEPVRIICLSNAGDLTNAVYTGLGIVKKVMNMQRKGIEIYENKNRGLGIYLLEQSPIAEMKAQTALYSMLGESTFSDMALSNEFVDDKTSTPVKSRALKDLEPVVAVGEMCVYRKKSGGYYASMHISGSPDRFLDSETDLKRFRRSYAWLLLAYMDRRIECEDYLTDSVLAKYLNC